MSERDEFEAWARRMGYGDELGEVKELDTFAMQYAWQGFQAARAPQAVPALTDEQIQAVLQKLNPAWWDVPQGATEAFARAILAAPQQAVPALRDDTWERFAAWLLDHCEGQVITEEFLRVQLGKMLAAAPQPSPEKCFRCGHAAHHGSCVNEAPRSED